MTVNIKNGPLAALLYAIGIDASNKGGRTRINSSATSAPTTSNDNTQGYQVGATWTRSDTRQVWFCVDATTNAAVWTPIDLSTFPGYVANNYYVPMADGTFNVGNAIGTNNTRWFPAYIGERCTLSALGFVITTAAAAGNIQGAIYANNPATNRPTGSALASTSNLSTTSTGVVTGSISKQLEPGLYWFAVNADNNTVVVGTFGVNTPQMAILIGDATASNVLTTSGPLNSLLLSQTFGTWPDVTASGFSFSSGGQSAPMPIFKVASVP